MSRQVAVRRGTVGRRGFLRVAPAALASGLVTPLVAAQPDTDPIPLTAISGAERVAGLEFTPAEQAMMQEGLDRNRKRFETLRELDIPHDTEPAVAFRPNLPGRTPTGVATPNAPLPLSPVSPVSVSDSLEDLAFEPVRTLADLLRRRAVSSTALTRMYLDRLSAMATRSNVS